MYTSDENHFPFLMQIMGGILASLVVGGVLVKLRRGLERIDAMLLFVAPASLFVLLVRCVGFLLNFEQVDWLSGRLGPTVALLRGYTLYSPKDSGPVFNTIYPPMSYLVYLPAGLMATPTAAMIFGNLISYLLVLGPILWLCLARHGDRDATRNTLVGTTVFLGFWKLAVASPLIVTFTVHADAPALGFGAMSCLILYLGRRDERPSNRMFFGSALCAVLALWSKQTTVALLVLLPTWVLLANGWKAAARFAAWIAGTLAAVSGALLAGLGAGQVLYNIVDVPKRHPWILFPSSSVKPFLVTALEESSICMPAFLAIAVLLYLNRRGGVAEAEAEAGSTEVEELAAPPTRQWSWFRSNYWALFAAAGLGVFPFALLARIKFGGSYSNYAPPLYYFGASACVLALDWYARNRERGFRHANDMMKVGILVSTFSPLMLYNFELLQYVGFTRTVGVLDSNSQEVAYRYALKHPGEAYFPWNPLSSLLAEGKAYHFEYGVFDRDLAGLPLTNEHFRANLPEHIRFVAYPPNRIMEYSMTRYLPDFNRRVQVPELPGWICYER